MYKHIFDRKGATLIEIVLTVALIGIIFTPIGNFMVSSIKVLNTSKDQLDVQHNVETAMKTIIDNTIGSQGIDLAASNENRKVFNLLKLDLLDPDPYRFILEYNSIEKKLYRNYSPKSMDLFAFADGIEAFSITSADPSGYIEIAITGKKGNIQFSINNKVYFRN